MPVAHEGKQPLVKPLRLRGQARPGGLEHTTKEQPTAAEKSEAVLLASRVHTIKNFLDGFARQQRNRQAQAGNQFSAGSCVAPAEVAPNSIASDVAAGVTAGVILFFQSGA